MVLNLWTLLVSVILLFAALLITLWKRPRLPLMTLMMIVELVFYLLCSNTVNNYISPTGNGMISQEEGSGLLLNLILGRGEHTVGVYELAFGNLSIIVAGLIVAAIFCILLEAYLIILRPIKAGPDQENRNIWSGQKNNG